MVTLPGSTAATTTKNEADVSGFELGLRIRLSLWLN
jgi:hypothetical protein